MGDETVKEGRRRRMPFPTGSHVAYARGEDLIVEWYDFGKDSPYESVNLLTFTPEAQRALSASLGLEKPAYRDRLARAVAGHFESYFEVQKFAQEHGIEFTKSFSFDP